jgi:hypothetical protein
MMSEIQIIKEENIELKDMLRKIVMKIDSILIREKDINMREKQIKKTIETLKQCELQYEEIKQDIARCRIDSDKNNNDSRDKDLLQSRVKTLSEHILRKEGPQQFL